MRIDLQQALAHPVARVFAVMSDPANRPLWQEMTSGVEILTPGPVGLGTRWRETTRGIGTVSNEVVGFEPDALWEEAGSAGGGEGRVRVTFRATGETTHLGISVEFHLKGFRRVMEKALESVIARQMPADLRRLEEILGRDGRPGT